MTAFIVKRIKVEIQGRILMSTIVVIQANVVKIAIFIASASKLKKKNKKHKSFYDHTPSLGMASQYNNAKLLMNY